MIDCTISGVSQDMDFEQGVTVTYLLVRLPSGQTIRAAVDESAAALVIGLQVKAAGAPRAVAHPAAQTTTPVDDDYAQPPGGDFTPAPAEEDPPTANGETVHVFGGQDVLQTEEKDEEDQGSPTIILQGPAAAAAAPVAPARSNVQRSPNGKIVVPSRTVPKNDRGYPIVASAGANPEELVGGRDPDEDGVGSV